MVFCRFNWRLQANAEHSSKMSAMTRGHLKTEIDANELMGKCCFHSLVYFYLVLAVSVRHVSQSNQTYVPYYRQIIRNLRGLFDKFCNTHIRQLWILILSPLLWSAASQKQMKLILKGLVATTLKKLRLLGRGVGETDQFFLWFFIVFRLFVVKLLKRGDNFKSHTI